MVNQRMEQFDEWEQRLRDATFSLCLGVPPERVHDRANFWGTGIFISPEYAVTADHNPRLSDGRTLFRGRYKSREIELEWVQNWSSEAADIAMMRLAFKPDDVEVDSIPAVYLDPATPLDARRRYWAGRRKVVLFGYPYRGKGQQGWPIQGAIDADNPILDGVEHSREGFGDRIRFEYEHLSIRGSGIKKLEGISGAGVLNVALGALIGVEHRYDPAKGEVLGTAFDFFLSRVPTAARKHFLPIPPDADPRKYLEQLREATGWIDIRGLGAGTTQAQVFPIDELYIPLATQDKQPVGQGAESGRTTVKLEEALTQARLVIMGDPGSGKTTFTRRIAHQLAENLLNGDASSAPPRWEQSFPVLIRIPELFQHIRKARRETGRPAAEDAPVWLADYLATRSVEYNWGLDKAFFLHQFQSGKAILLLDGLDEPPGRVERAAVARLFENATQAYGGCRFVVTTRPQSYAGEATLAGFKLARIEPLEPEAVEIFLDRWCEALFPRSDEDRIRHRATLGAALRGSAEIRRLARSPVMLTALAVVHFNQRTLPEQRAELYDAILRWLSRSREDRPKREKAEICLRLLQPLALAMQDDPRGRQVQIRKGKAAEILASEFRKAPEPERFARAERFLDEEEVDSGIIVSRDHDVAFWHLTFQEHLAARALAAKSEADLCRVLLKDGKIYRPEWREVALLLGGVLATRVGTEKVDWLIQEMLAQLGSNARLDERARCAGLLGAMVSDLRPLEYEPKDPCYRALLDGVLGIFDVRTAASVSFWDRLTAAEALGQAGDPRLREHNWVRIEAGEFLMGAQKNDPSKPNYDAKKIHDSEYPVHKVHLNAFEIGRYPVTVEEYRRFLEDDGYQEEGWWQAGGFGQFEKPWGWDDQILHPNRPVVGVSWYEAAAYCAWAGNGVRLPTEAEWERAARGTGGRKYPWGEEEPDKPRANFNSTVGHPTPVGLYPLGATSEGIEDLAGNVMEWVADWCDEAYYRVSAKENPKGPESGTMRVSRGASWGYFPWSLRAALRTCGRPEIRLDSHGFRCAREVSL